MANVFDTLPADSGKPQAAAKGGNVFDTIPAAKAAPSQSSPPENPYSAKNLTGAAVEPFMGLMTGAVSAPLSGLAGIVGAGLPGEAGQGARWTEGVGRALTYQPQTQGGRTAMQAIGYPFEQWAHASDYRGRNAAEVTGSPAAGAMHNAVLQLIPQLLGARGANLIGELDRGRVPAPPPDPNVKVLADKGVTMTPGQIAGGKVGRIEQKAESIPILGDAIREAKVKGVEQFSTAGINDALAPIGKKLPAGLKGNEALEWARHELGQSYDTLLPNLKGDLNAARHANALPAPPKPTLMEDLNNLRNMGASLPEPQRGQLGRIIDREIIDRFTPQGKASGETIKNIESKLGEISKSMRTSSDYDVRTLGQAVEEMQGSLRRMIEDVNPQYAKELQAINQGYSKFKIAQRAGASTAANEGVATPTQYHAAVKAKDTTKDKRAYSEGTANQNELSTAGKAVLPDTVRNSGTADRLMLAEILRKPWLLPPAWLASLAYSQPSLRGIQSLMMKPPRAGEAALRAMPGGAMQQGRIPEPPL